MAAENIMYSNENVMVTYRPDQDDYHIRFRPTREPMTARLFMDQRLLEEFSRNDISHLSKKLELIDSTLTEDLSRTDVERIHGALVGTMQRFERDVRDFRKKEAL